MSFNNFNLNIIFRSLLLALTALGIAFLFKNRDWLFTLLFLCVLFSIQVYLLISYVGKINKDLANFLIHIKEQDTTLAFSKSIIDKSFSGLSKEFEKINLKIKKINNDKIKNELLLDQLINQVGTGIVVINEQNKIVLRNKAINELLDITEHNNIALVDKLYSIFENLNSLKIGDQRIETIHINKLNRRILISISGIKEDKQKLKVYSFHDIDKEMTDYELQSWNGLIKVLSHEIMNTLTPMSTVVDTLKDCMCINAKEKTINQIELKDIKDTVKGINLLDNRLINLQNFIKKFRQFLDIPVPELKEIRVSDLFNTITETYKNNSISFEIKPIPESVALLADKDLIELVLINIIKNAIEANATAISISAYNSNKHIIIEILDNGNGIESFILKKVFLPFYTTKKDGSGIGLSLARQIMFSHGGEIILESIIEKTSVKLFFKNIIY